MNPSPPRSILGKAAQSGLWGLAMRADVVALHPQGHAERACKPTNIVAAPAVVRVWQGVGRPLP